MLLLLLYLEVTFAQSGHSPTQDIVSLITLLPKSLFHIIELSILFSTAEASAHADKVPKSSAN